MKVVIIGGVAGGASAAARLRRLDEHAQIVMLERGPFVSFTNCGLPYYIGGSITRQGDLTLQTPQSFKARFAIDVRINSEAVAIDTAAKCVHVHDVSTDTTYAEPYDKLLLAPGAEPLLPPIPGLTSGCDKIFTLRTIPDTLKIKAYIDTHQPKAAVIAGGGYIGVEMAENLVAAGLSVTLVELADHLIAPLDFDMAADVHHYLRQKGVQLLLKNGLTAVEDGNALTLTLQKGTLQADLLLMCVGVRPETQLAKACGVALNPKGAIVTNAQMQTNVPDLYAVGDAVQVQHFVTDQPAFLPLAGPANKQGRVAADSMCGEPSRYSGTQGSAVLKLFDMTIATTGLNEAAANAAHIAYDKTYLYAASHATYYPGATNLSLKILWDAQTHRLLGAQAVGFDGVDKRMDVLATAIRFGAKATDLAQLELCYAPPFGSAKDPVNMAGFVAENVISGKLSQFFWHEVDGLPRDGSVSLLDVRTAAEVQRGKLDGFVHIPLDTLREHLSELAPGKPVYVHCHSGLRSYVACRILTQHGFVCHNLAGGYRLYESATRETATVQANCATCQSSPLT